MRRDYVSSCQGTKKITETVFLSIGSFKFIFVLRKKWFWNATDRTDSRKSTRHGRDDVSRWLCIGVPRKILNKIKTWTDSREVAVSRILKDPNQPPQDPHRKNQRRKKRITGSGHSKKKKKMFIFLNPLASRPDRSSAATQHVARKPTITGQ